MYVNAYEGFEARGGGGRKGGRKLFGRDGIGEFGHTDILASSCQQDPNHEVLKISTTSTHSPQHTHHRPQPSQSAYRWNLWIPWLSTNNKVPQHGQILPCSPHSFPLSQNLINFLGLFQCNGHLVCSPCNLLMNVTWSKLIMSPNLRISLNQFCEAISFTQIILSNYFTLMKRLIQGYINLKRYILFITLDTCKKYLYPKFNMFWYLGKKLKVNMIQTSNFIFSIN